MDRLAGRVAVVTSSTRGLGRAIAGAFVAEGAAVVLNGRSEEKGHQALAELGGGEDVAFVAADVTEEDGCEALLAAAIERFGRVDVLVNNAGGTAMPAPVAELSNEALARDLAWNLWSTLWCMRLALADMLPRGWGRIINVSTLETKTGEPILGAYCAAKLAVNGLTKSCAAEVGGSGVTVNALCPGAMETDIMRAVGPGVAAERGLSYEEYLEVFSGPAATRRLTDVEDVAEVAVLLASEEGAAISGSLISVDGGVAPY